MKKIFAVILAVVLVLSMCACMNQNAAPKLQSVTEPTDVSGISYNDYEDSLEGLCAYFADMGYAYDFPEATGDEMTDPVVMNAKMIGADKGYKFTYTFDGNTIVLELYSYSDRESDFYKQIESEGKVTVTDKIDEGTVDAVLSDNGKYVMIYTPAEENEERDTAILEAFKGFYA